MAHILILHGPNLNLLGTREPSIYGGDNLAAIDQGLRTQAAMHNHALSSLQSNAEHELVDKIHNSKDQVQFIIINPAAFTHSSIAIRDALLAVAIPFIEVHLSNIYAREKFRQHSYFSDIAIGLVSGLGPISYKLALDAAIQYLQR